MIGLVIPQQIINQVYEHCRSEVPNEACGILIGGGTRVMEHYPLVNAAASPTRYFIEPREMIRVAKVQREKEMDLKVIYHSHTKSEPFPSAYDRQVAFHTDAVYLIVSLQNEEPEARAFNITGEYTGDTMENTEITEIAFTVEV